MFVAPAGSPLCQSQLDTFLRIAEFAGIPIKSSKTVHPSEVVPMYGIEVDKIQGVARLPQDKLHHLIQLLREFSRKRSLPLRQWQSLIGHLSFASRVIRPGRPYIHKFIDRIRGVVNQAHYVKLTRDIHSDCIT